jgi:hypothetical protein
MQLRRLIGVAPRGVLQHSGAVGVPGDEIQAERGLVQRLRGPQLAGWTVRVGPVLGPE